MLLLRYLSSTMRYSYDYKIWKEKFGWKESVFPFSYFHKKFSTVFSFFFWQLRISFRKLREMKIIRNIKKIVKHFLKNDFVEKLVKERIVAT